MAKQKSNMGPFVLQNNLTYVFHSVQFEHSYSEYFPIYFASVIFASALNIIYSEAVWRAGV